MVLSIFFFKHVLQESHESPVNQESDVTEVEVKIDPMSLLCLMEDDDEKDTKDETSSEVKKSDDEKDEEEEKQEEEDDDIENQRSDVINKELASFYEFICKDCGTKFETYTELDSHCRQEHNKRGVVECHCGKLLSLRSRLVTHRQHHTGAFPFKYVYFHFILFNNRLFMVFARYILM